MRFGIFDSVSEHAAIAVVNVGLGFDALGEDYVVGGEFEMEIFDPLGGVDFHDRTLVYQGAGRDEGAFQVQGVQWREVEISLRRAFG